MATPVQIAVTAQTQQAQAAINGLAGQFQGLFNSLKTGFGIDLAGRINQQIMRIPEAEWAKGLPLDSDGYVCDFYKKDD